MSQGKFLSEGLLGGDDGAGLDMAELPSEYLVKLNGFLRNAIHDGHETLTRVLLDKGADVNYITSNSQLPTALHVAVSSTRENILPLILPQASSATIQAALQFAIQYQSRLSNIINILQKDGAVIPNNGNTKDKDKDKSAIDKPAKDVPPKSLQESETQTTAPSRQESETQTNGEGNGQKASEERGERKESEEILIKEATIHKQQLQEQHSQQQQLHQQFQEQQKLLLEQQQLLHDQLALNVQAQKKADSAQEAAATAQHLVEELKVQLKTQDEQLETQKGQVQKLTSQLATHEELSQKLTAQLSDQESQTHKLTDQLTEQINAVHKLVEEVRAGETQIGELKARIFELEGEKSELRASFLALEAKNLEKEVEFQAQIDALQKDIEVKTRKIENISTERDSERRAKEVVKRILTSSPKDRASENSETLGHSHAIRMASVRTPSPSPPDGDDFSHPPLSPSPSPTLRTTKSRASSSNINGTPRGFESEKRGDSSQLRRSKTGADIVALVAPGKSLSSKSRSKDDMDIASEADRARVRRLVERWEEMKYLEPKQQ